MFICDRCGNSDPRYIGYKKNGKPYCRLCLSFNGDLAKPHEIHNDYEVIEELNYSLSEDQEKIANGVRDAFINHKDSLIYAVCGAGKTELVYRTIAYALSNNMQVGFTIPRRDVVIELEPRIKSAFPNAEVTTIYGGHNSKLTGDILLLTCHQLYRYKNYFDLLIIDETDAFPYKGNTMLYTFFKESIRGNYIMMSATPLEEMILQIKQNKGAYFELQTRYHKHPLPVPQIKIVPFFKEIFLVKKLKCYKEKKLPCLVFAPTIKEVDLLFSKINPLVKGGNAVHSKNKNRNQIVLDFKKGKYDFLITSSILERGITLKNLQVIIYEANDPIFDEPTLIQIAGRVGRKIDAWDGEVIYLASFTTKAMNTSIMKIKESNTYVKTL